MRYAVFAFGIRELFGRRWFWDIAMELAKDCDVVEGVLCRMHGTLD